MGTRSTPRSPVRSRTTIGQVSGARMRIFERLGGCVARVRARWGSAVGECLAWWSVLSVIWLATAPVVSAAEVIAAGVVALPCAVSAAGARRAAGGRWQVRPIRLRVVASLPAAVLGGTAAALSRSLRQRPAGEVGRLRRIPLAEADAAGRLAVAELALSIGPAMYVADEFAGGVVVHELVDVRSGVEQRVTR